MQAGVVLNKPKEKKGKTVMYGVPRKNIKKAETRHSDVGTRRKKKTRKTRSDKGTVRQSTLDRWARNTPLYD